MKKSLFEQLGSTYYEENGYLIPNLKLPAEEEQTIGIWGKHHLRYLKESRRGTYINLLTSGRLNAYLAEIDKQAEDMFFRLVKQIAEREHITESLKANSQMKWIQKMNSIYHMATEIVNSDLIYS